MTEAGFFAQKQSSPTSLALVILLHAAVLAAVIMIKGPQFIRVDDGPFVVRTIPIDPDPDPVPPPPRQPHVQPPTQIDRVAPVIPLPPLGPPVVTLPPVPPVIPVPQLPAPPVIHPDPPAAPVRRAAELDPRFAGQLQPPYPAEEIRAQREGRVQVRVTIAPNGRVSAIVRLMATSEAFWRVTEQQAREHWRFRPATVDGRPVADSKVMTLQFRLVDL
ncbi:MAG TPA: energy transducer TonB [Allosphingosinicella sp.]|nr:energy transducer TonB [Allosphingosinicella sp.]